VGRADVSQQHTGVDGSVRERRCGKRAIDRFAGEGRALQPIEAGGALDIGEGGGVGLEQARELAAAEQLQAQLLEVGFGVVFDHAEQVDHVAREVVQDLVEAVLAAPEEHAAHPHKRLGIGAVRDGGDARGESRRQVAFSPDPRRQAA